MAAFTRRLRFSPVLPTALLGATVYATSSSLSAEEVRPGVETRPGRSRSGDKLPIYPTQDELVTLVEVSHPISPYITQARESTSEAFGGARQYVEAGVSRWIGFERRVEREVKTVLPSDEALTPGIIYVLIAGLTGSVLSRTRSFPIRFLTPPLFTLAALPYFLPKTAHNLRNYLSDVEDRNFPAFASEHDRYVATASSHWEMLKDRVGGAGQDMEKWKRQAVEGIEKGTGLKVGDVVKRGQETVDRVRAQIEQPVDGAKLERVGYVVEQKPVAELVRPVVPAEGGKRIV